MVGDEVPGYGQIQVEQEEELLELYAALDRLLQMRAEGEQFARTLKPGIGVGIAPINEVIATYRQLLLESGGSQFLDILSGRQKNA